MSKVAIIGSGVTVSIISGEISANELLTQLKL